MPTVLPNSGNVSLTQLTESIRCASEVLGVPDVVSVRTLVVEVEGRLANAATLMRVGFEESLNGSDQEILHVGPLTLVSVRVRASTITEPEQIAELLGRWATLTKTPARVAPQFPASVDRHPSSGMWKPGPSWVIGLHDLAWTGNYYSAPRGPFYSHATRFYAETIGEAAVQWVQDPHVRDIGNVANVYRIVVRDRRLEIATTTLSRDKNGPAELRLTLRTGLLTAAPADIAIVTGDFDGEKRRTVEDIDGDVVVAPLDLPLRSVESVVLDRESGAWLDRVHFGTYGSDLRLSLEPVLVEPKYQRLRDDLERGECETVEFKAFVELFDRDKKSRELLKEVTAFSNASGGVIYIGVNDDAEVTGVSRKQLLASRRGSEQDFDELRTQYADLARRIINEGISPTAKIDIQWISHAELQVLRIDVHATSAAPHYVVEDNQYWFRRGGSCKKGLPEQFIARGGLQERDRQNATGPVR